MAAEMIEEAITPMRKLLEKSLVVITILYLLLWLDGIPALNIIIGISAHLSFIPILKSFPYVHIMSPKTWIPLGMLLLNHFVWFRFFIEEKKDYIARQNNRYGRYDSDSFLNEDLPFSSIMGFMVVFVWMIPIGFFVSVMDVEEALPSANIGGNSSYNSANSSYAQPAAYSQGYPGAAGRSGGGDDMMNYNDYGNSTGANNPMSMPMPMDAEPRRGKKGGLLKKFLDPIMAKKDSLTATFTVPMRKDR